MMNLKERIKNVKLNKLISAAAILIIGLMFVIFPEHSATIVCYMVGAVLCVVAVMDILVYFAAGGRRAGSNDLVMGICFLAGALVLFIKPVTIAEIITVILGIALIAGGAMKLQLFLSLTKIGGKSRWTVLGFAVLSLVLGAVMAFDPFSSHTYLMIYAGISLIVYGALELISELFVQEKPEIDESKVIDIDD